jgi:hypothetical protein
LCENVTSEGNQAGAKLKEKKDMENTPNITASDIYRAARHYGVKVRCKGREWQERMSDHRGQTFWGYLGGSVSEAVCSFEERIGKVKFPA